MGPDDGADDTGGVTDLRTRLSGRLVREVDGFDGGTKDAGMGSLRRSRSLTYLMSSRLPSRVFLTFSTILSTPMLTSCESSSPTCTGPSLPFRLAPSISMGICLLVSSSPSSEARATGASGTANETLVFRPPRLSFFLAGIVGTEDPVLRNRIPIPARFATVNTALQPSMGVSSLVLLLGPVVQGTTGESALDNDEKLRRKELLEPILADLDIDGIWVEKTGVGRMVDLVI